MVHPITTEGVQSARTGCGNTTSVRKMIRGSIVGTRLDLAECLQFASGDKGRVHYSVEQWQTSTIYWGRMRENKLDGRVVMKI